MNQDEFLALVKTAFEPHLKTPPEAHHIRVEIARHIASLAPKPDASTEDLASFKIPSHVTGVRRQYLKALHANLEAKQRYSQARHAIEQHTPTTSEDNGPSSTLHTHLDLLKLQRRLQRNQTLIHYVNEAESLAQEYQLFNPQSQPHQHLTLDNPEPTPSDHGPLQTLAEAHIRKLSLALLQANHELKHEQQLLSELQARSSSTEQASTAAKLHALAATRAELTQWIEQSLARCDTTETSGPDQMQSGTSKPSTHETPINYDQAIDEQYQKYLRARARLIEVAEALTAPQPLIVPDRPEPGPGPGRGPNPQDPKTVKTSILSPSSLPQSLAQLSSTLPYISSQYIPLLDEHRTLSQSRDHIKNLLAKHEQDLSQQLLRLSDESHLLPEYPILVETKKMDQEVGEVEQLLRAWSFAMEAASTATAATVQKQVQNGRQAVNEADDLLDSLAEADEMWKKIDHS